MPKPFLLAFALALTTASAHAATLPDACGDDKVKFDTTRQTLADQSQPPAEGKARIVFVEMSTKSGLFTFRTTDLTTRFGIDGKWAGGVDKKSYLSVDVAPGEHHLCASVQGKKDFIGVTSFTAEPGKVYYFQFEIKNTLDGQGFSHYHYGLTELNEDEGKFRVKTVLAASPAH